MGLGAFKLIFIILAVVQVRSVSIAKSASSWKTLDGKPTVLLGHQGEKVIVPAHTLAAYEIAAIAGAEYVEPDLVMTQDNILVCYHDMTLKGGTDVASHPEFQDRMKNFTGLIGIVNETIVNDWFVQDFTLAELRKLIVYQKPEGVRLQYFNDMFHIATFQEYLDLMHKMNFKLNRTIGIIPELKHPSFHNRFLPERFMENKFLEVLQANGYPLRSTDTPSCQYLNEDIDCPPVIIQNFDKSALEYIRTKTDLEIMMVVHPELPLLTFKGIEDIATVANHFCVWKEYMYVGVEAELAYTGKDYDKELIESLGGFIPAKEFVTEAHRLGMKMSLFTINDSREPSRRGCAVVPGCEPENKMEELFYFFDLGVDTMFIESIAETRELRVEFEKQLSQS